MNTKATITPQAPPLKFAISAPHVWQELEELARKGWVARKVQEPESVQSHTISLRILACSCSPFSGSELEDLLDMLEVHDWPEAIVGDEIIVTNDKEERERLKAIKFEKEKQALVDICIPLQETGTTIFSLWLRFETSNDQISSFGRQLDKYQAVEKALYYEKTQYIPCFKEFHDYAQKDIAHPILVDKMKDLLQEWVEFHHGT